MRAERSVRAPLQRDASMILTFADVITPQEHGAILAEVARGEFVDGSGTAGAAAAAGKHNQQLRGSSAEVATIGAILLAALRRHEPFRNAAYPKQLHSTLFSRYRSGMSYAAHVDNALMGETTVWRTDLSLTLFLNDPGDYDGGELAIESGSGEILVKLPARSLVCYPTGQLHRVRAVTRGERIVAVAWVQSHVRDNAAREVLRDLALALDSLAGQPHAAARDLVARAHANLLRRWSEP
jgi:PKHD-type hydroxylase